MIEWLIDWWTYEDVDAVEKIIVGETEVRKKVPQMYEGENTTLISIQLTRHAFYENKRGKKTTLKGKEEKEKNTLNNIKDLKNIKS